MPANAQAKAGIRNQPKPAASKNATKTPAAKAVKPIAVPTQPLNPTETTNVSKPAGKISPHPMSLADSIPSTAPAPPQEFAEDVGNGIGINKKKQKRRQKEAARRAAEAPTQLAQDFANVADSTYQGYGGDQGSAEAAGELNGYYDDSDYEVPLEQYDPQDGEHRYYIPGPDGRPLFDNNGIPLTNGYPAHDHLPGGPRAKKKKSRIGTATHDPYLPANPAPLAPPRSSHPPPPPPPPLGHPPSHRANHHDTKDRIWNTSTAEERERIKEFWLQLGEEDRRSLVKVEKEAVLKKMKEQQKHSCSCTVCGRKRTAIEEELEVLYDAYYEELEQYANVDVKPGMQTNGTPSLAPPQMYAHPMARLPPNRHPQTFDRQSSKGRIQEVGDDDELGDEDEDYSDDEEDYDISEDEIPEEPRGEAVDFFNFGKNLTVQGGILTVADDLLKNDGKKFIEMMEQLAERRMQREEEQQYAAAGIHAGHNHGQPLDDDGYDEDEDDEYDSQEEDDYEEEDDMEALTEKQRMDEGRRMFQIFAARMFEQRVLTAYREKVALERQQKLLEELDDESRVDAQREAKKAKEAQKKKDKKRQQKAAKDEERAKREAEKADEEAAVKALEEQKAEGVRQRKEEQRKKKDAEKRTQEEEKQRKEAEKQKRLQDAKDQQVEQDRKQREAKEREKKKKEELKKKEREEREMKEKEAREKKERDGAERQERENRAKADNDAKDHRQKDEIAAKPPSGPKRPTPITAPSGTASLPQGLYPPSTTSSHASPRLPVATPILPKAPTPKIPISARPRQASYQDSHNASPKASQPAYSSSTTSPSVSSVQHNGATPTTGQSLLQSSNPQQSQPPSRYSPGPVTRPPGLTGMPPISTNAFASTFGPPISPLTQQAPYSPAGYSSQPAMGSGQPRNFVAPNGMPFPPGFNGPRHMPQVLDRMVNTPLAQTSPPGPGPNDAGRYGMSRENIAPQAHSRNTSASYERPSFDPPGILGQAQPISRPAPIGRPSSVAPHQQHGKTASPSADVDEITNHLGSKALLDDDTDDTLSSQLNEPRGSSMAPGAPRSIGRGFGNYIASGFSDRMDNPSHGMPVTNGNKWGNQQSSFGHPPMPGAPSWSNPPGFGRSNNNFFGSTGGSSRPNASRPVAIRLSIRQACETLSQNSPVSMNAGWHRAEDVLREIQFRMPPHEAPVSYSDMKAICDTEGNAQNGGGSILVQAQPQIGEFIRFESGRNASMGGRSTAGDIGSPIVGGSGMPAIGGQRSFQQPGGY